MCKSYLKNWLTVKKKIFKENQTVYLWTNITSMNIYYTPPGYSKGDKSMRAIRCKYGLKLVPFFVLTDGSWFFGVFCKKLFCF